MTPYPMMLAIAGWPCLVVGGGSVATRKVEGLLAAGAAVTVVSPDPVPALQALHSAGRLDLLPRLYQQDDLAGFRLVIAATNNRAVNRTVAMEAQARGLLVNVVDAPEEGNFTLPAVIRRGALTLTVSTGTSSPALARRLRGELEEHYGPGWARFVWLLGALRPIILAREPDEARRRALFQALAASELPTPLTAGDIAEAERMLAALPLPMTGDELRALLVASHAAEADQGDEESLTLP